MKWTFSAVCEIQLSHAYFGQGQGPAVCLVPTAETENQLRETGLYFKQTPTGGAVVGEPSRPMRYPGGFTFWLVATTSAFFKFTQLPDVRPGQTLLALTTRNAHLENADIVLSADADVAGITNEDCYSVKSLPFPVRLESGRSSVFGVVEIRFAADVPVAFSCVDSDLHLTPRCYKIAFAARQAYWRYVVVTKYRPHTQASDLTLTGPASDPVFQGAFSAGVAIQLADGTRGIPFMSKAPFPLQSRAVSGFTLTKNAGLTQDAFAVAHLPNPAVDQVKQDPVTSEWLAEQLLYI